MVTLGKAAGVAGAAVAAHAVVIDWLVNGARPFIFTTSTSPLLAHTVPGQPAADGRRGPSAAPRCVLAWPSSSTSWRACRGPCCRRTPSSAAADWQQRRRRWRCRPELRTRAASGCRPFARPPCRPARRGCALPHPPPIQPQDIVRVLLRRWRMAARPADSHHSVQPKLPPGPACHGTEQEPPPVQTAGATAGRNVQSKSSLRSHA